MTGYNLLAQGTDDPTQPSLLRDTVLAGLGTLAFLRFLFASSLALVLGVAGVGATVVLDYINRAERIPEPAGAPGLTSGWGCPRGTSPGTTAPRG